MQQKFKRSLSFLMVVVMVVGIFATVPFATFASGVDYDHNASTSTDEYYNLISKTDWDNAPGISESEIVLNNDAGDYRQVLHIMKADVNNSYVSVIPTYTEMNTSKYQTGTMLDQANWIDENMDGEVIGVMNCCLSWYTGYPADRVGEPLGFMMLNGEIMFDPGNCGYTYGNVGFPTCVVINKDFDENGNPRPVDIPKVEMPQIRTSADLDGWEDTVIPISSGYIVKDGVNQYKASHGDSAPRSVVGITADGQVVIMENDGRQSPFSVGMNMYECAEVMIAAGCVFAANCDGGGSSTFVSQRPGEELKVNNSPSDGGLRPSTSGICFISTAPADGQFYKAHISAENEYYTPNSTVQFDVIGTDMVGTVVDVPVDAAWQLVDNSFGTINDGVFTSNGKEGDVVVQLVYNGEVVGEASITIVLPEIAFRNETIVIGYGDTMDLPIEVTTNEGRNTVTHKDGDIVYTLSDEKLGIIVGDQFTACDESTGLTGGTLTAVICGQEDKAVIANIRFGKASEIVYDFEDGYFPIDTSKTGNIGGDDAEDTGEYIYGWHINDTRANGYFSYRYYTKKNYTPVGMDIPAEVYLVNKENGLVRNGNYAMGVDIDWTNVTASCHGQMDIHLPESLDLTDATSVGFWMYIPAELVVVSMNVNAGFTLTDDTTSRVDYVLKNHLSSVDGIENGGWYYFSWEVLENYKSFDYIQINSHYTATAGVDYNYYQDVTYYIDDITIDYSDAVIDRENPYFTSMTIADENGNGVEISGQTVTTNTINLMAQAYENISKVNATGLNRNSVKLYVDGVLSDAVVAVSAGGAISVDGLYLNDGVHTIVMEISDNQGNVGNIVRKLTVNTDKSDVRLEVPAADGLLPTGSIFWLNVVADNLAKVNSVTITVNLDYVNDWELEGMEVAYGFKAEYYINNHNDAVITFTRTGEEVVDTTILAKLPIRIWMAKGWMDDSGIRKDYISNDPKMQDKYWILTPHAMWYSDGTRDYRLAVAAEAGVVTYVDGSTITFSANETVIQTEMNRYYSNADRQNKWSFHICTAGEAQNKAATCTESGYIGRTFCTGCACGSVENLGTECDTHNGCGSVIDWGTIVEATGHNYEISGDRLVCKCGVASDASGLINVGGKYCYATNGKLVAGWVDIEGAWYYFDTNSYASVETYNNGYVTFKFEETGKLVSGEWYHDSNGSRYYYGPTYYTGSNVGDRWFTIDGKDYCFGKNGYCLKGYAFQRDYNTSCQWYDFGEDGACKGEIYYTGLIDYNGYTYSLINGVSVYGFSCVDGAYYYSSSKNGRAIVKNIERECVITNKVLPAGIYRFGADGKMLDDTVCNVDGVLYYYILGKKAQGTGSVELNGSEWKIDEGGKVHFTGVLTDASNTTHTYVDGVQGIKQGLIKDADGAIRYYVDGVATYAGLVQDAEGNYYYINSSLKAVTGRTYTIGSARTNGLLPAGTYEFGADGKMINVPSEEPEVPEVPEVKNGLVKDTDGAIRYYVDGVATYAGLVQDAEGNYYYINSSLKAVTGRSYTIGAAKTNGLLPAGRYEFDADGKMINVPSEEPEVPEVKNGLVKDADGAIRYYVDGVATYAGLVQDAEGNYYYINSSLKAVTGRSYTIGAAKTNGLLPAGRYEFDADGKLILSA